LIKLFWDFIVHWLGNSWWHIGGSGTRDYQCYHWTARPWKWRQHKPIKC